MYISICMHCTSAHYFNVCQCTLAYIKINQHLHPVHCKIILSSSLNSSPIKLI